MAIRNVFFEKSGDSKGCTVRIVQSGDIRTVVDIYGYRRIITKATEDINLTPYLLAQIGEPDITEEGAIQSAICPTITIDGQTYSAEWAFLVGEQAYGRRIMSDLPYRVIAPNQVDYIAVSNIPEDGGRASLYTDGGLDDIFYNDEPYQTAVVVPFSTDDMLPQDNGVEIKVFNRDDKNTDTFSVPYKLRPMGLNGQRLAWINKYGVLECWNFDFCREEMRVTTSESIYTSDGYRRVNRRTEKHITLETRELPKAVLDALSFIISSPRVWIEDNFSEIDIITEECRIFSDGEHSTLQITYRPTKREI